MSDFHPIEVVGRGSETQLQMCEDANALTQRFKGYYKNVSPYPHLFLEIKKKTLINFLPNVNVNDWLIL